MIICCAGYRQRVPHLWVYFVLNQILPLSFTQNLFFTTITLVTKHPRTVRKPQSANYLLRLCAVTLYVGLLYSVPSTLQTQLFIPALLLTRALLFAPFLIDLVSCKSRGTGSSRVEDRVRNSNWCCSLILAAFGISSMLSSPKLISREVQSTAANYAAAALSNDLLIGLASSLIYQVV